MHCPHYRCVCFFLLIFIYKRKMKGKLHGKESPKSSASKKRNTIKCLKVMVRIITKRELCLFKVHPSIYSHFSREYYQQIFSEVGSTDHGGHPTKEILSPLNNTQDQWALRWPGGLFFGVGSRPNHGAGPECEPEALGTTCTCQSVCPLSPCTGFSALT